MNLSDEDIKRLQELEGSLWRDETRFDQEYMNGVLASDFVEFGRSGCIYQRKDTLAVLPQGAQVKFPLRDFAARLIETNVVLVTYVSEVTFGERLEVGNRSSLWVRTPGGWQLAFHQGTPKDIDRKLVLEVLSGKERRPDGN